MSIVFRKADLSDVPRLIGLPREGEAGGDWRMLEYLAGSHHPQQALAPRAMWMATADNREIGYVAGHLTKRYGCDGEIQWIYVVPHRRRTHVASTLLCHIANWFVDNGAHKVCVDVGDDAARPFYRSHGAVELNKHWMVWNDIERVTG